MAVSESDGERLLENKRSLESTLEKARQAKATGENILTTLGTQTEQLERTQAGLIETNITISQASAETTKLKLLSQLLSSSKIILYCLITVVSIFFLYSKFCC